MDGEDGGGFRSRPRRVAPAEAQLGEPGGRLRVARILPEDGADEFRSGFRLAASDLDLRGQQQRVGTPGESRRPGFENARRLVGPSGGEQEPGERRRQVLRRGTFRASLEEPPPQEFLTGVRIPAGERRPHQRRGGSRVRRVERERPLREFLRPRRAGGAEQPLRPRSQIRRRQRGPRVETGERPSAAETQQGPAVLRGRFRVRGERRPELQDRPVVPVAGGVRGPAGEVLPGGSEEPGERGRPGEAVRMHFVGDAGEPAADLLRGRGGERAVRPDEQGVAVVEDEERRFGEHLGETADHRLHFGLGQPVEVDPLAEEPAGGEPGARLLEELDGEERGDAAHPGVRGLRDDHFVALAAEPQVVPGVHPQEREPLVVPGGAVGLREQPRRFRHLRRDLGGGHPGDRVAERRAGGDAAAVADDEDRLRPRRQQERQMRQETLGEHVRAVGGVHLAVDREREFAGGLLHRNRGGGALFQEDEPPPAQQVAVAARLGSRGRLVEAAGEQLPVPGARRGRPADGDRRGGQRGGEARTEQQRGGEVRGDRGEERRLDAEERNQQESGGQRPGGVPGGGPPVDDARRASGARVGAVAGGGAAAGGQGHREGEGGAEERARQQ